MTEYSIFSHRDYTHFNLEDAGEYLNNEIIRSSCFAQEKPDTVVFPSYVTNLTLVNCNLDNVDLPPGVTLIDCSHRRILTQPDGLDWIVDENNNPVEPV